MIRRSNIYHRKIILFYIAVALLLFLVVGFLAYKYSISNKANDYLIKNSYYGFGLQAPKGWVGEEKTIYSESNIGKLLVQCQGDKTGSVPAYEIGAFRFKSQRYPQEFGGAGYNPAGLSSGVMLDIRINCITDSEIQAESYGAGILVGGEKAAEGFLSLPEFGETKYLSFLHNGLQYKIIEYIYISPEDQKKPRGYPENLRKKYGEIFDKITSSFKFIQ